MDIVIVLAEEHMTVMQRLVIATGVIMIVIWMSIDLFGIALLRQSL